MFDVENALIYNVGTGAFSSAQGIEFRYGGCDSTLPGHLNLYEVVDPPDDADEVIAETSFTLARVARLLDRAEYISS
ncbi:hypothetical protein [Tateyamaria sp. Alg231-49]|uniref:hypothetical protein n=1 Tax=Tateyamaria sp. Alg231-49 TaxID=1922219 RepID=UPI00131F1571|nr:hypothetical protein [Tateyamaria sp. Alg231-49]